jgi:hypothetical protein
MEKHSEGIKPTCREVHRLVSEGMDRELTLVERTRMRLHLLVCEACTRFNGQMDFLRRAMRKLPLSDERDPQP